MGKGKYSPGQSQETETAQGQFVNPFENGVTYAQVTAAMNGKTIKEYLSGQEKSPGKLFDEHDINWLEAELK